MKLNANLKPQVYQYHNTIGELQKAKRLTSKTYFHFQVCILRIARDNVNIERSQSGASALNEEESTLNVSTAFLTPPF